MRKRKRAALSRALAEVVELRDRCKADPLFFGRAILGRRRWEGQERIRRALEDHRYVHVRSANGVGKTHELASIIAEWPIIYPGSRVLIGGPSFDSAKYGVWAAFVSAYKASKFPLGGRLLEGECAWILGPEHDVRVANPDNPDSLQGARGKRVLIVLDEAHSVEPAFFDPLKSLMTASASRMILSGNPLYPTGPFRDAAHDPATWHCIKISGFDHPNVRNGNEEYLGAITRLWIDERRAEFGSEDDPRYVARVLGEFPTSATMRQVFALSWLEAAADLKREPCDVRRMGLDLARQGGDANAVSVFDETRTLVAHRTWHEDDTERTVARAMETALEFKVAPENVKVDACGLGGPIVDRLVGLGWNVEPVDFGAGPEYDWLEITGESTQFVNRRAELYWTLRELVRRGLVTIPREFSPNVWRDLTAVERLAEPADRGRIKLEPKEAVRKRIGRSPDSGDSAVLAFSNVGNSGPIARFV